MMEIQFKKMNFKKFIFFMFFISISVNASDLEFNEKGLVCFAENNIYNSIGTIWNIIELISSIHPDSII